jgi:chromosome segregation ATPase
MTEVNNRAVERLRHSVERYNKLERERDFLKLKVDDLERQVTKLQESLDESREKKLELYNHLELARKVINIVAYECSKG